MIRIIATYVIVGAFVVTSSGCIFLGDSFLQGTQDIGIILERAESSDPVQDALVRCARQDRRGLNKPFDLSQTDYLARRSRNPVRTNEFGRAVLTVHTVTDRGWKVRDQVTGEYYMVQIQHGDSGPHRCLSYCRPTASFPSTEIVTLRMRPGDSVRGCFFKIRVEWIGEPKAKE